MIKYLNGDLFANLPKDENILIPHISNNSGQTFHVGFVQALNARWPYELKEKSPQWIYLNREQYLGKVDYIKVESDVIVANMCAQDNVTPNLNGRCRYGHLASCMIDVKMLANDLGYSIYAPKFGAGIGGKDWNVIEELIEDIWDYIDVTIFSL